MSALTDYVHDELSNRKQLWAGPNCAMPDNAAHALAMRMHDVLIKNDSPDSFHNLIELYRRLNKANTPKRKDIRRNNTVKFDKYALQNEIKNAMQQALELPGMKGSSCYTKRTDVIEIANKFYNNLLDFAITKLNVGSGSAVESVVESAPEPAVESASEPVVESAPESVVESAEGGKKKKGGKKTAKKHTKNLCLKKSTQKKSTKKSTKGKSKCESIKGCKIASGSKRTYCRKSHNKTHKKK